MAAAPPELWIDGRPASMADLAHQALVNYGAFTSFRVEDGGTRGLDRHLSRLEASAVELFGEAVGEARLRDLMRGALGGRTEAWMRVSLFAPEMSTRAPHWVGGPRVMVGLFDPPAPLPGGVRLQSQIHEREAPHLKHAATFGLLRARRQARLAGRDDALFLDRNGWIGEGTLWNIGFIAGDAVVWPEAAMLDGVAQQLIRRGLATAGTEQRSQRIGLADLVRFDGAFLCNSATPAAEIAAIDDHVFPGAAAMVERVADAWRSQPRQAI